MPVATWPATSRSVQPREEQHIQQSNLFQPPRVAGGHEHIQRGDEREGRRQKETQSERGHQKQRRAQQSVRQRQIARGKGPSPFRGVMPVGVEIEQIVPEIHRRGRQTEHHERQRGLPQNNRVRQLVRGQHRDEQNQIFDPLMRSHRAAQRPQTRRVVAERLAHPRDLRGAAGQGFRRIDHHRLARAGPDPEIVARVPGVIKAVLAETPGQRHALGGVAEIGLAVAGHHVGKQSDMIGNRPGHVDVRSGGEHQRAAVALLRLQPVPEGFVIRHAVRRDPHPRGQMLLEMRAPTNQQTQRPKRGQGIFSQQPDERFPHHVRANQRAVQIHGERDRFGLSSIGRGGHVVPPA